MVNIVHLFLVTVSMSIVGINCNLQNILSDYYKSEALNSFKTEWHKHKKAYEHALAVALRENYGNTAMNVFVKRETSRRTTISKGFIFSDNVVKVLLFDMVLRDMPNLFMPDVSLELPSNMLKLEGTVSKIFIDTSYYVARNDSAILYGSGENLHQQRSPFSLQQVQTYGKLVIIAEDCFLNGFAIVTLAAESVNVGHSTFHLNDCKFTAEISPPDFSLPPVISPYFAKSTGRQIERLMSEALLSELSPKLQGAMYSYINTSTSFGDNLSKYRFNQQKIFKKTSDYLSDFCIKLNSLTLQENRGSVRLKDFEVRIESKTDEVKDSHVAVLKEVTLYGLDTAYAARAGGSFDTPQLSLADAIRFSSMQIRGKASFKNGTQSGMHDFAAELVDVTVNIIIFVEPGSKPVTQCEVVGWRSLDFSIVPWETPLRERVGYQSLVTGYIINEVPPRIIEHLSKVLTPVVDNGPNEKKLKGLPGLESDKKDAQNKHTVNQGEKNIEDQDDEIDVKHEKDNNEKNDEDNDEDDQIDDDDKINDEHDQNNDKNNQNSEKNDKANDEDDQDIDKDDKNNEQVDQNNDKDNQNSANIYLDIKTDYEHSKSSFELLSDGNDFFEDGQKAIVLEDGTKMTVNSDQKLVEEVYQNHDKDNQNSENIYLDIKTDDENRKSSFELLSDGNDFFEDGQKAIVLEDGTKMTVNFDQQLDNEYEKGIDHKAQELSKDYKSDKEDDDYGDDNEKVQEPPKDYIKAVDDISGINNNNSQSEKDLVVFAPGTEEEMTRRTGKRNQSSVAHKTNHAHYNENKRLRLQLSLKKTTSNRKTKNLSDLPKLKFRKNLGVNIKKPSPRKESFTKKNFQIQGVHNTTRLSSVQHMSDNEIQ